MLFYFNCAYILNWLKFVTIVCCIYNKPHCLDSSSSSDDDCCGGDGHDHGGKEHNRYDRFPKHQRRAMRELEKKQN